MSKYFTIKELTKTSYPIKNIPGDEIVSHLEILSGVLDGIREAWGGPITISSSYRSPELNRAVGGVETSAHCLGWAADLQVNDSIPKFFNFVADYLKNNNIKFDQLIIERSGRTQWVHFGLYNKEMRQRGQIFKITK